MSFDKPRISEAIQCVRFGEKRGWSLVVTISKFFNPIGIFNQIGKFQINKNSRINGLNSTLAKKAKLGNIRTRTKKAVLNIAKFWRKD